MAKMKIKPISKKGIVTVKLLMQKQSMMGREEAVTRKGKVEYLTHMTATVNGKIVWEVSTGPFVSNNPYMQFTFDGTKVGAKKGDKVEITLVDSNGKTQTGSKKIKFK